METTVPNPEGGEPVNRAELVAEIRACEERLSHLDFLIPKAERPLHDLWELRREEHSTLMALRSRLADSTPEREEVQA